jgi:hypothetical protein
MKTKHPNILTLFMYEVIPFQFTLGGLVAAYLPKDPRFASSNPAHDDGFLRSVTIHSTTSSKEK